MSTTTHTPRRPRGRPRTRAITTPHPWLKAWREQHGLTMGEAAALFGLARTETYARWEYGERALEGPALRLAELYQREAWLVEREKKILEKGENTC